MPQSRPPSHRPSARRIALVAVVIAICAAAGSAWLATAASGGAARSVREAARIDARISATKTLATARRSTPLARAGRCVSTVSVPGQGRSCRTADGMYIVPQASGAPLLTHGPDIVDAAAPRRGTAGGFGTPASILCAAPSRTRHIVLTYLVPSDFASGLPGLHGDRYAEVAPQMRQGLYDAAAVVDARAGELAPGTRRRMRVQCDADGTPTVERVVLPHTASEYLAPSGGFSLIGDDLERMGLLPTYAGFAAARLPSVRRVLAYYDADFEDGFAGQGTMYRRSSLLATGQVKSSDPVVSRTVRNINNNPPRASFAIQYGTATEGVPDPPLYTSLLHELAHTLGAVQDEPPTSSDAGHCTDGLDVMCYFDGGPGGAFTDDACPDLAPPFEPMDERFDCNGDTYFHPSAPVGNPLAAPTTWQLGLVANETFSGDVNPSPMPLPISRLIVRGAGTSLALRWSAVASTRGPAYDLAYRPVGGTWSFVGTTSPTATPSLLPGTTYEFAAGATTRDGVVGLRATGSRRTGRDTSPPSVPGDVRVQGATRTSARLAVVPSTDNVGIVAYRIERQRGSRWVSIGQVPAPRTNTGQRARVLVAGLRPGTSHRLRLRARDAANNVSGPSRTVVTTTSR